MWAVFAAALLCVLCAAQLLVLRHLTRYYGVTFSVRCNVNVSISDVLTPNSLLRFILAPLSNRNNSLSQLLRPSAGATAAARAFDAHRHRLREYRLPDVLGTDRLPCRVPHAMHQAALATIGFAVPVNALMVSECACGR